MRRTLGAPCDSHPPDPIPHLDLGIEFRSSTRLWKRAMDCAVTCRQPRNYIERVFERRRHAGRLAHTANPMTGIAATALRTA